MKYNYKIYTLIPIGVPGSVNRTIDSILSGIDGYLNHSIIPEKDNLTLRLETSIKIDERDFRKSINDVFKEINPEVVRNVVRKTL